MDEQTYRLKIRNMLQSLSVDSIFILSEKVAPENTNKFIEIVKSYIDSDFGHLENFQILFNNDYSKIRKDTYLTKLKQS